MIYSKWRLTSILAVIISLLSLSLLNFRAYGAPLQITVTTEKEIFSNDEEIPLTITLKNVSGGPIVLPEIEPGVQQSYIHLEVVHESGVPIFFVSPLGEKPIIGTRAGNTQVLQNREELVFTEVLNEGRVGFLGYTDPHDPNSLQFLSGKFSVVPKFIVDKDNLPTAGNAAVFRGTIASTEPTIITVVVPPIHAETKTGGSRRSTQVQTSMPLTAVPGDFYIAAISTKPDVDVLSVQGMGINWSRLDMQCGRREQTAVQIWLATSTPTGDGRVTATLASRPKNAVIAVSRYSLAKGFGGQVSANTKGLEGVCAKSSNRSVDTANYSVDLPVAFANSVAYGAVGIRLRDHTPGPGFTERAEVHQPMRGDRGDMAGLAIVDRVIAQPSTVTVVGTLNSPTDWTVIAVEIKAVRGP